MVGGTLKYRQIKYILVWRFNFPIRNLGPFLSKTLPEKMRGTNSKNDMKIQRY